MVTRESGENPKLYQGTVRRSVLRYATDRKVGKAKRRDEAESGYEALSKISWGCIHSLFLTVFSREYGLFNRRILSFGEKIRKRILLPFFHFVFAEVDLSAKRSGNGSHLHLILLFCFRRSIFSAKESENEAPPFLYFSLLEAANAFPEKAALCVRMPPGKGESPRKNKNGGFRFFPPKKRSDFFKKGVISLLKEKCLFAAPLLSRKLCSFVHRGK